MFQVERKYDFKFFLALRSMVKARHLKDEIDLLGKILLKIEKFIVWRLNKIIEEHNMSQRTEVQKRADEAIARLDDQEQKDSIIFDDESPWYKDFSTEINYHPDNGVMKIDDISISFGKSKGLVYHLYDTIPKKKVTSKKTKKSSRMTQAEKLEIRQKMGF